MSVKIREDIKCARKMYLEFCYENDKYIRSMIDDSMITYDEIIEEKKLLQQICDIKYVFLIILQKSKLIHMILCLKHGLFVIL